MMKANRLRRLTIILILAATAFLAIPLFQRIVESLRIRSDAAQVASIIKACQLYATDWDGMYPFADTSVVDGKAELVSSTEAFSELIRECDIGTEAIFSHAKRESAQGRVQRGWNS